MRYGIIAIAALLALGSAANAQEDAAMRPEIRTFLGALIPTGDHRDDFKSATTLGVQGAIELSKYAHVVGSFAWSNGHAKFASLSDDLTNVWHYDVGGEFNAYYDTDLFVVRPFFGLGVGGRTYDYAASGQESRTCTTGYGALGAELQVGSVAVRTEGRDYINCFQSPISGRKSTRNDVMLTLGFAYHLW